MFTINLTSSCLLLSSSKFNYKSLMTLKHNRKKQVAANTRTVHENISSSIVAMRVRYQLLIRRVSKNMRATRNFIAGYCNL